jgi:hypothetical protein
MRLLKRKVKKIQQTEETAGSGNENRWSAEQWETYLKEHLQDSPDFTTRVVEHEGQRIFIFYLTNLVTSQQLNEYILEIIQQEPVRYRDIKELYNELPVGSALFSSNIKEVVSFLIEGSAFIYMDGSGKGLLVNIAENLQTAIEKSETESSIYGPKIAFSDSLSTNISLIRKRINDSNLCTEKFMIGERNKREIRIIYVKDIADEENVQTLRQRINEIEIDDIIDTNVLNQLLDDQSMSLFPQLVSTELPDRVAYMLMKGKVGVLVDRSPNALVGPATLLNFFEATEDVYTRWNLSTFIRVVRFAAIFMSIMFTPAYVAALTYNYEVIPSTLLVSLGQSRANVPFPPVIEALILEFTLELLREAGARLPTKVGQTMGIVGGIVIGQAAVEAGFTSNILIIIVAISSLGTFTAPSYMMGTVVRIIRFPFIILAGMYGGIGIMAGLIYVLMHLLTLTSLGRPYLAPLYPFRSEDVKDSIFRFPPSMLSKRPVTNRPPDQQRFSAKKAKQKKDIDE